MRKGRKKAMSGHGPTPEIHSKSKLVSVRSLKPNAWNFNIVPAEMMVSIVAGIHRHGFVGAILVWKGHGIIIDGEHRWIAAKKAGLKRIPVIELDVTEAKARELTIAFNQNRGYPDEDKLADAVRYVADATEAARGELQVMLGFTAREIDGMLHDAGAAAEEQMAGEIKNEGTKSRKSGPPKPPTSSRPPPAPEALGLDSESPGYGASGPEEKDPSGKFPFTFYAPSLKEYERMGDLFRVDGKFSYAKLVEMLEVTTADK